VVEAVLNLTQLYLQVDQNQEVLVEAVVEELETLEVMVHLEIHLQ
jgi:hypothetical protein